MYTRYTLFKESHGVLVFAQLLTQPVWDLQSPALAAVDMAVRASPTCTFAAALESIWYEDEHHRIRRNTYYNTLSTIFTPIHKDSPLRVIKPSARAQDFTITSIIFGGTGVHIAVRPPDTLGVSAKHKPWSYSRISITVP